VAWSPHSVRHFASASSRVLVIADHDNKHLAAGSLSAITAATKLGKEVHVLVAGKGCADVAKQVRTCCSRFQFSVLSQLRNMLARLRKPLVSRTCC